MKKILFALIALSSLCAACHEYSNARGVPVLSTYSEWTSGPYPARGQTCQECHMKKSKLGHNMQSYNDINMGKTAVDFQVETLGYIWRDGSKMMPQALVKIEMINRAGHSIPDG